MDLIHKFLNIIFTILTIILFVVVLPALSLYRILRFFIRSVFRENLAGKVVLITGASSGIGEHLAYEYAKHGAHLALVARREKLLSVVAAKAKQLGSPEAIVIKGDVSKLEDCKRFVDATVNHFGKLDYLINNAGMGLVDLFEDQVCITDLAPTMDVNFWGSINTTHFALPYLRKSKGRIIVVGSCGGWFNTPRVSVYNASKIAQQSFFETLRIELGSDVGITMATLGTVNTQLANDEILVEANLEWLPRDPVEVSVKAIVNSARRGDDRLTEPPWQQSIFLWVMLLPDLMNWARRLIMNNGRKPSSQTCKSHTNGTATNGVHSSD